jgi:glycosyltransferase involved in cell wall biosynthesis
MKLVGLCVTKDEVDIIGFCLRHASQFCDKIYVLDNGSTDGTWEIINDLRAETIKLFHLSKKNVYLPRDCVHISMTA